jgi:NAD(P)-dependent dehydrogenase (short-subunit alcohol dehydrogenase family)
MYLKKFDLTNKVALITGAAGLLGVEHCEALLEIGAHVILCDINRSKLAKAKNFLDSRNDPSSSEILEMDVIDEESILAAKRFLDSRGTYVDILINNAAINPIASKGMAGLRASRLEYFSIFDWNNQIAVGLTGAFLCSKTFGNTMACSSRGGVILNIASDLSVLAPDQRIYRIDGLSTDEQPVKPVTYSVIKAGLVGLTKYLSTYWAQQNVRSNALSPGGVFDGQDDYFVKRLQNLIPIGRMANRDEYRSAIQFLCSDASAYMNGQNVVIDGGRSVW